MALRQPTAVLQSPAGRVEKPPAGCLGTVLVADPAPLFLVGVAAVCASLGVRATAVSNPDRLDAAVSAAEPEAALVNPRLWPTSGLGECQRLKASLAPRPLGILTDHAQPSERERVRALGFAGYLDKPRLGAARLAEAVSDLLASKAVFPAPAESAEPQPILDRRELAVLHLLAAGLQVNEIARRLDLGERTVKTTMAAITQRFGAANRVQAVALGCELGLLDLPASAAPGPRLP